MSNGVLVLDAGGVEQLNTSVRVGKLLGSTTVSSSGSLTDAGFSTGTPWYIAVPTTAGGAPSWFGFTVSFSGNTMTWMTTSSCTIYYGVF